MKKTKTAIYIFIIISVIIVSLPIIFIFTNSLMSTEEIFNRYTKSLTPYNFYDIIRDKLHYVDMSFLPKVATLSSYKEILFKSPSYLRGYLNSVLISLPVAVLQCIISATAAYAFEMMKFKYKEIIYFTYIIIMLMPMQILLVPHFLINNFLGISGGLLAIILPAIFRPFGTFLCRQNLKFFPKECIEAALIDGADEFKLFFYITLPYMKATIATLFILTFAIYWNVVDEAVIFINDALKQPLSIYLSQISGSDIGLFFSASFFYLIPPILLFLIGQDYLIEGVSLSVSKG